jgi:hypothetical protein
MLLLPGAKRHRRGGKSEASEISSFSGWIAQYAVYKYTIPALNDANNSVASD